MDKSEERAEEVLTLRRALSVMLYEATHLSPAREDGSHDCRISAVALETARHALARTVSQAPIVGSNFTATPQDTKTPELPQYPTHAYRPDRP